MSLNLPKLERRLAYILMNPIAMETSRVVIIVCSTDRLLLHLNL